MNRLQVFLCLAIIITGAAIVHSLFSPPPPLPTLTLAAPVLYGPFTPIAPPTPSPLLQPNPSGQFIAPPSLSEGVIRSQLMMYHSPLVSQTFGRTMDGAAYIYREGIALGIDPGILMAFFWHESHYGTQGIANQTDSVGNLRPLPDQPELDGYRYYRSWAQGVDSMYSLLLQYADNGAGDVALAVPVWAPPSDNNNDVLYIQDVLSHIKALTTISLSGGY